MDINKLDRITNASIAIENADALLFDLYEDYFTDSDYKTLIYEAESRPYMLTAKILAIMHFLDEARLHIDTIENPKESTMIKARIEEADELRAIRTA